MSEKTQQATTPEPLCSDRELQLCKDLMRLFNEWRLAGEPMREGSPARMPAT